MKFINKFALKQLSGMTAFRFEGCHGQYYWVNEIFYIPEAKLVKNRYIANHLVEVQIKLILFGDKVYAASFLMATNKVML